MSVENNFKQTEIGLIPEDWEVVRFENAISKKRIKVGKVKQQEYKTFGKYPVIDQSQNYIAGYNDEDKKVYQGPLPVIIFGDHTRIFKFIDFPFIIGADGVKIIIPNYDLFDPKFLYFALLTLHIPSRGYNRHYHLLREKKIPLPPLEEQRKIAKVLDEIQQAIEVQDKIIQQVKNLKKSLMQKLFTEGLYGEEQKETEIGLIPKSWEVVRLGEVITYKKGKKPKRLFKVWESEYLPYLTADYFRTGKPNQFVDIKKEMDIEIVNHEDVVLIWDGSKAGDTFTGLEGVLASTMVKINVKDTSRVDKKLVYYFLTTKFEILNSKTTGSTIPHVNKTVFENLLIPLPPLEEQKQIAHILSTIDKKIEVEQKRKEILKELFETMLHKLMSGEIRLKDVEI
jgi:type I restriction enzyme S subunit